ncbi:hypothetical protein B0T22DRAFT_527534 [Podospora appendiculata]|uniref:Uncharacterized protein n=1 Tax=Podospora appendiculata TaxID=314037 RepID=A0AAE1CBW5_9PEZI|nr:hypothetical protein B0T22DRAFT_527534 [Podospora appendiculata]
MCHGRVPPTPIDEITTQQPTDTMELPSTSTKPCAVQKRKRKRQVAAPARKALVDDIIALYKMKHTVERVKRYTPDCVYNDQFGYANDRYKMAGQWFALPKLVATINALVPLSLDPATIDFDFIRVYNEGLGASFKCPEVEQFKADKDAGKEERRQYGTGKKEGLTVTGGFNKL